MSDENENQAFIAALFGEAEQAPPAEAPPVPGLGPADPAPTDDEATAREHARFLTGLLGGATPEPPDPDAPPDFDAGVREPAPAPEDPVQEHNAFMLNLVRASDMGGFGE